MYFKIVILTTCKKRQLAWLTHSILFFFTPVDRTMVYYRWCSDYAPVLRKRWFGNLVFPVKQLVFYVLQRKCKKDLWAHGIGRHPEQDVYEIGKGDLLAVSEIFGHKKFLFREKPCLLDAALFAFIASSAWDCPESPLHYSPSLEQKILTSTLSDWGNCITQIGMKSFQRNINLVKTITKCLLRLSTLMLFLLRNKGIVYSRDSVSWIANLTLLLISLNLFISFFSMHVYVCLYCVSDLNIKNSIPIIFFLLTP